MSASKFPRVPEFSLKCRTERPGAGLLLKQILVNRGIAKEQIIESRTDDGSRVSVYDLPSSRAQSLIKNIRALKLKGVIIQLKTLRPKDWEERWRMDFRAFRLTKKFDVVPKWRQKEYRPTRRIPIIIDTITAFGTGQHETTRFMVELIERCEGRFDSFLDAGTGTGILSIAALYCGAQTVDAIDIDPEVMGVAKNNLRANGFKFNDLRVADLRTTLRTKKRYDFVAANLVTSKLMEASDVLVSLVKPGKLLAISGISVENMKKLKTAYRKLPLRCLKVRKGKEWAAILYKKTE